MMDSSPQAMEMTTPAENVTRMSSNSGEDSTVMAKDPMMPMMPERQYLSGRKLALVMVGLLTSLFLLALDQTIVATAQPQIVSQFNALEKIQWVASAYFMTQAGFMLPVGQLLTVYSTKVVYLIGIFVFELGSLICGVSPSINVLIFGRALAGVGAAVIFTAILVIIAETTRLEQRSALLASFGAVFGLASAVGPIIGGAFTDNVTWRWCFYINLPVGAISIISVVLILKASDLPPKTRGMGQTWYQNALSMDYVGTILNLGFVVSLLLALQWGGSQKPWSSGDVIACLVVAGVSFILFILWEHYIGPEKAMLPLHLVGRRTQWGSSLSALFTFMGFLIGLYYLPLWYQAVRGVSASRSGIDILAFLMAVVAGAGISGAIIRRRGYYWPFLAFPNLLAAVGSGLLFTISPSTPNSRVIGYQFLTGITLGMVFQTSKLSVQGEYAYEPDLVPQGTALVNFSQFIGAVLGITVGGVVFLNKLTQQLEKIPGLSPAQILHIRNSVNSIATLSPELKPIVISAYSDSLNDTFIIGVPVFVLGALAGMATKNLNLIERSASSPAQQEKMKEEKMMSPSMA